ncbi:hypothetical protein [Sphingorhabdus sp.]|uniref:hypothetical protein n=1 Tax=Sphingorhabdus sp. TaxID=1902408 RepID=UPI00391895BA
MSNFDFYSDPMSRGQIVRWALHDVAAEYLPNIQVTYRDRLTCADYVGSQVIWGK